MTRTRSFSRSRSLFRNGFEWHNVTIEEQKLSLSFSLYLRRSSRRKFLLLTLLRDARMRDRGRMEIPN